MLLEMARELFVRSAKAIFKVALLSRPPQR